MAQKTSKSRHRRKHSVELNADKLHDEVENATTGDAYTVADVAGSPSGSNQVENTTHNQQNLTEDWAATHIQTAFRGFLVLTAFWHPLAASY